MAKRTAPLLPSTEELLVKLGERLRLSRLRRKLPAGQVAERAGMSPMTLRSVERGGSGVTIGAYLAVMQVLGVEKDLDLLASADPVGRGLQDARMPARLDRPVAARPVRVVKDTSPQAPAATSAAAAAAAAPGKAAGGWIGKSGFASTSGLASLIKPASPKKKR